MDLVGAILLSIIIGLPLLLLRLLYQNTSVGLSFGRLEFEITARTVLVIIVFLLIQYLSPRLVPFGAYQYWYLHGSFLDILATAWPVFAWGGLTSLVLAWLIARLSVGFHQASDGRAQIRRPSLGIGIGQSIWLGVSEELGLRWLAFYCLIALLNWLGPFTFFSVLPWFYTSIAGPAVNFITFGWFSNILFHPNWPWAVGAAIVLLSFYRYERGFSPFEPSFSPLHSSNLARLAYWPANLFLYLVMFRYGIIVAILVHVIYEVFLVVLVLTIRRRIISAEYIRLWKLSEPDKSNSQRGN